MAVETNGDWWSDHGSVCAFAKVLVDNDYFRGGEALRSLIYYFEKPYKWADEHARWSEAGSPEDFDFSSAVAG